MNNFLGNLIDRHLPESNELAFSQKVQPRPKARFETTPLAAGIDPGSHFVRDDGLVQNSKPDSETGSILPQPELDASIGLTTDKITLAREQHPLERHERPKQFHEYSNDSGYFEEESKIFAGNEQIFGNDFSFAEELSNRIEKIQQRLQNQQPVSQSHGKLEHSNVSFINDKDNTEQKQPNQSRADSGPIQDSLGHSIKEHFQKDSVPLDRHDLQQAGLLQIPGWLTEMQAELNHRWQELNTKAEAEPVVNVTIGRVEVRAVQTGTANQPKAQKKPSGVMSLDDYLKQREHRGQG